MDGQLPNTHKMPSLFIFGCFGKKKFTTAPKSAEERKAQASGAVDKIWERLIPESGVCLIGCGTGRWPNRNGEIVKMHQKKEEEKMTVCHIVSYFVEKVMPYISW